MAVDHCGWLTYSMAVDHCVGDWHTAWQWITVGDWHTAWQWITVGDWHTAWQWITVTDIQNGSGSLWVTDIQHGSGSLCGWLTWQWITVTDIQNGSGSLWVTDIQHGSGSLCGWLTWQWITVTDIQNGSGSLWLTYSIAVDHCDLHTRANLKVRSHKKKQLHILAFRSCQLFKVPSLSFDATGHALKPALPHFGPRDFIYSVNSSCEGRKEAARLTPLLTPSTLTRLATWNIRTMYETGKTVQVAREMKIYKIGVLGLSETRWLQSGQLRLPSGEQLLYSGHIEEGAPPPLSPPPPPPQYWGCGPDVGTRGTCGTHRLGACQLSHHHSQVYHQEEKHQAEHHPVLCSHQWCGGREEGWLLPATTSSVRQKRNKGHNRTDGRFQRQDWNGRHGIQGHHGDTWTGTDEWKWWALCRPVRPEPAGDRRQHLPTQALS